MTRMMVVVKTSQQEVILVGSHVVGIRRSGDDVFVISSTGDEYSIDRNDLPTPEIKWLFAQDALLEI